MEAGTSNSPFRQDQDFGGEFKNRRNGAELVPAYEIAGANMQFEFPELALLAFPLWLAFRRWGRRHSWRRRSA